MELLIVKQAHKELKKAPKDILTDIYSLFEELRNGKKLEMPISRPLSSISKGLHELRLSEKSGEYRVFYVFKKDEAIYVLHVMNKKTQKISQKTVKLIQNRIRNLSI